MGGGGGLSEGQGLWYDLSNCSRLFCVWLVEGIRESLGESRLSHWVVVVEVFRFIGGWVDNDCARVGPWWW